jgi:Domain of unknown function (DUF4214)/Bacterial Ig-like domain (group 3)
MGSTRVYHLAACWQAIVASMLAATAIAYPPVLFAEVLSWAVEIPQRFDTDLTAGCEDVPPVRSAVGAPDGATYVTGCGRNGDDINAETYKVGPDGRITWSMAYRNSGGTSLALDAQGALIVAGYSIEFNIQTSRSQRSAWVTKHAADTGRIIWRKSYLGPRGGTGTAASLVSDATNNIFIAVTEVSSNESSLHVMKINGTNGGLLWTTTVVTTGATARALTLDPTGNPVVTGIVQTGSGKRQIIISKLDNSSGVVLWNTNFSSQGDAIPNAIAVDTSGDIYVTGESSDPTGGVNMRTLRLAGATGNIVWTAMFDGPAQSTDVANHLVVDAAGDVVVTGRSNDLSGLRSFRTVKYSGGNGTQLWTSIYSDPNTLSGEGRAISSRADGTLVATGSTVSAGVVDVRTVALSSVDGSQLWTKAIAGLAGTSSLGIAVFAGAGGESTVVATVADGSQGNRGLRVAKYSSAGVELFQVPDGGAPQAGLLTNRPLRSFAVDHDGNIIIAGTGFYPSESRVFISKRDRLTGQELWRSDFDGQGLLRTAKFIAVDRLGDIFVINDWQSLSFGLSGWELSKLSGRTGAVIWRITNQGTQGNLLLDNAEYIAVDSAGHVIVAATNSVLGAKNAVLIKYNSGSGGVIWIARRPTIDVALSTMRIAVDRSDNIIYAASASLNGGPITSFAVKLDGLSGAEIWTRNFPDTSPRNARLADMRLDVSGNPYFAFTSTNPSAPFDERTQVLRLAAATGIQSWTGVLDCNCYAEAIALDAVGDVYASVGGGGVAGLFKLDGSDGAVKWSVRRFGEILGLITIDRMGQVLSTGAQWVNQGWNAFVTKFDQRTGQELWSRKGIALGRNYSFGNDIAVADGAVYMAGTARYDSDFTPFLIKLIDSVASTTDIALSAGVVSAGNSVTMTATVTGFNPGGTITFSNRGLDIASCVARPITVVGNQSRASCTFLPTVGSHLLSAAYGGDRTNLASVSQAIALLVDPAPQTISMATPADRPYSVMPFSLVATASSGLMVTFASRTPQVCSVSGASLTLLRAGSCTIAANQAGNSVFNPASERLVTFSITKASQSVVFNPARTHLLDQGSLALIVSSSSGLPVTLSSVSAAVCRITGLAMIPLATGPCIIIAEQMGDDRFEAAARVSATIEISVNDSLPDPFAFAEMQRVVPNVALVSAPVIITGINVPSDINVTGGTYSIGCGVDYTLVPGKVSNGQRVCVRHVTASTFDATVATRLTVGGVSADFVTRTLMDPAMSDPNGDFDRDGIPNLTERTLGLNVLVKDNDVFTVPQLFVGQLYRDFLGREADALGRQYWVTRMLQDGVPRSQVVVEFAFAAENELFERQIARLYFATYLRAPDANGLRFWAGRLRSGMLASSVAAEFAQAGEFVARYGALSNRAYVEALYVNVLGRSGDIAGIDYWTAQLAVGQLTRGEFLLQIANSVEFASNIDSRVSVSLIYVGLLGRAPDGVGLEFWAQQLASSGALSRLIDGFLGAPEYRARFLP